LLWSLLAAAMLGAMALTIDPLGTFNALMPKDRASTRVAQGVPYGAGERLKLDVYAPRSTGASKRPVILFFYGGSWNSGRRQGYAFAARALAARCRRRVTPISFTIARPPCAGRGAIPATMAATANGSS
jgi:acetyl esterase/lipase